jgi:hypothetical protein
MKIDHAALHDELRKCAEEKPAPLTPELAAIEPRKRRHKALRAIRIPICCCDGGRVHHSASACACVGTE